MKTTRNWRGKEIKAASGTLKRETSYAEYIRGHPLGKDGESRSPDSREERPDETIKGPSTLIERKDERKSSARSPG